MLGIPKANNHNYQGNKDKMMLIAKQMLDVIPMKIGQNDVVC